MISTPELRDRGLALFETLYGTGAGVRATVDSIHDELDGTMKKLAGKVGPQTATTASALVN